MAKYLFVYHGGKMPETPEEGARIMAAWNEWMAGVGKGLIDGGNPVGQSITVQSDSSVARNGGANPVSGYTIIEAANEDAAIEIAKGCPILSNGGSVELAEAIDM